MSMKSILSADRILAATQRNMWLCSRFRSRNRTTKSHALSFKRYLCWFRPYSQNMNINSSVWEAATKLWNYMQLNHTIEKSDVILVLGNNDLRTARYAADLYKLGFSDRLMFSGKDGSLTRGKWDRPEADVFHDVAVNEGVPEDNIILERNATNTGENILFSSRVLESLNIHPQKIILVQTPYMERRTYATFMKQFPGAASMDVMVTSPDVTLEDFPNEETGTLEDVICMMVGCLQRIKAYPDIGYQIPQGIPNEVWEAYQFLRSTGQYDGHLMS